MIQACLSEHDFTGLMAVVDRVGIPIRLDGFSQRAPITNIMTEINRVGAGITGDAFDIYMKHMDEPRVQSAGLGYFRCPLAELEKVSVDPLNLLVEKGLRFSNFALALGVALAYLQVVNGELPNNAGPIPYHSAIYIPFALSEENVALLSITFRVKGRQPIIGMWDRSFPHPDFEEGSEFLLSMRCSCRAQQLMDLIGINDF